MNERVYIHDEQVEGTIIKQMAYGAIVSYITGGIEYQEMLAEEDYEVLDAEDDE